MQVRNESSISAVDGSYSSAKSERTSVEESCRRTAVNVSSERYKRMPSVTGLSAASTICLSPPVTQSWTASGHWLNCSLPSQSRGRVYSEDGTLMGSTRLQRGRPNCVKSGLPSPLQRSLVAATGISSPAVCSKEVAVIDTSPILSTYSVTSAVRNSNTNITNDNNVSALSLSHCGSKVSLNAHVETALDDSAHNQAFTESMLADSNSVAAAEASDVDTTHYQCDDDVASCHEMSQSSSGLLTGRHCDPALLVRLTQSSTTSLDSAVDAENLNGNESLNIPRSFSKQSIVSHDSGVGLADPQPFTAQYMAADNKLNASHLSGEGSRFTGRRGSVRQQSVRFNLQVSTDVRNLLSKAGVEALIERDVEVTSQCEHAVDSCRSSPSCVTPPSSSRRKSKLVPVLPISTNLLRVSCASAKRYITNAAAVAASPATSTTGPPPAAVAASPATSITGPPRIKSALTTPSIKQCLNAPDGTSQLRSRFRGKPVKRLQSCVYPTHSPVNPLSPRHVATSRHMTVPVPFDLDV